MAPPLMVAGTVTSAQTRRLLLAAMAPVLVSVAPTAEQSAARPLASARKTTDQPTGSVGGVTPGALVAAKVDERLKLSDTALTLFTCRRKRVTVGAAVGVTLWVVITAAPVVPKPVVA